MDADRVLSSGSGARWSSDVPAPLDGEIIPPRGRTAAGSRLPPPASPRARSGPPPGAVLIGAMAVALLGLGAAGGYFAWDRVQSSHATEAMLAKLQHDVGTLQSGVNALRVSSDPARADDAVHAMKKSVDAIKAEFDAARSTNVAALGQLSAKVEKAGADPSPKLAEIAARLDRIERQVSSPTVTGTVAAAPKPAAPAVAPTPPVTVQAAEKPASKPATLGSWVVRDVYDGIALVEGRGGGIREVTPGEFLPGAGEVRSIERRGRNWIVVTSRGVIDDTTW